MNLSSQASPKPPSLEQLQRVVVLGTTGSGKTTLARELSQRLDCACVELDALHWDPNWTEADDEVFRQRIQDALKDRDRWAVDGNYSKVRDLVWPKATAIVWLDYPIWVIMNRLFWRTLLRWLRKEELWNGNREQFRANFLSKDSLFLWALQTHWKRRRELPPVLAEPEHAHISVVRLRSPRATRRWLRSL